MKKVYDMEGRVTYIETVSEEDSCIVPTVRKNTRNDALDDNMEGWTQWY